MTDNQELKLPGAEQQTEIKKPFNFKEKIDLFLMADGEIFDDYYEVQKGYGVSDDQNEAQVCTRVEYKTEKRNVVGDDPAELLLVPIISGRSIAISAPPVIPSVIDEIMPQELLEVVRSDDVSREPTLGELKCVEIGIWRTDTYKNARVIKGNDIYRVDLTKEEPVLYKRFPIPENEKVKKDAAGDNEGAKIFSAIMDFLSPLPAYRYEKVSADQLENIVQMIDDCRKG